MRPLLLDMFKLTYKDNNIEYEIALDVVFKGHIPTDFKNVPIFMNNEERSIEEILKIPILNE